MVCPTFILDHALSKLKILKRNLYFQIEFLVPGLNTAENFKSKTLFACNLLTSVSLVPAMSLPRMKEDLRLYSEVFTQINIRRRY